jgi:hypothetical protein
VADTYDDLGPDMRARLDKAELDMARVRDYIDIMADSDNGHQHARVLCLLLGLARPRPRENR